jgi:hypothetical protein
MSFFEKIIQVSLLESCNCRSVDLSSTDETVKTTLFSICREMAQVLTEESSVGKLKD